MSHQLLQVNFRFNISRNEYEQAVAPLADDFAKVPGCQWKIWLMNEKDQEAGGIYLFEDEHSLEEFRASALGQAVLSHPALSDFNFKQFEVLENVSAVTRAPLALTAETV